MSSHYTLERALILEDGRVLGRFSDEVSVWIDASGVSYVLLQGIREVTRGLVDFAATLHRPRLKQVLAFRNAHTDIPRVSARVEGSTEDYQTSCPTAVAWWPPDSFADGVEESENGVCVKARAGVATLRLSTTGRIVWTTFPARLRATSGPLRCDFVWIHQTHTIVSLPSRWKPALVLAQARQAGIRIALEGTAPQEGHKNSPTTHLPSMEAEESAPTTPFALLPSPLPTSLLTVANSISTLPSEAITLIEWTPDLCLRFYQTTQQVEAVVSLDNSCLLSNVAEPPTNPDPVFLFHFLPTEHTTPRTYATDGIPVVVTCLDGQRYDPQSLTRRALEFREKASFVCRSLKEMAPPESPFSCRFHECVTVEGVGHFSAYEDRRVRVVFADETILELDAEHCVADVIQGNGCRTRVNTTHPLGVEEYVRSAMEFAFWAFQSPSERAAFQEDKTFVHRFVGVELDKMRRFFVLNGTRSLPECSGPRLPASAAPPQEDGANEQEERGNLAATLRELRHRTEQLVRDTVSVVERNRAVLS